jgi:hypothetical protein
VSIMDEDEHPSLTRAKALLEQADVTLARCEADRATRDPTRPDVLLKWAAGMPSISTQSNNPGLPPSTVRQVREWVAQQVQSELPAASPRQEPTMITKSADAPPVTEEFIDGMAEAIADAMHDLRAEFEEIVRDMRAENAREIQALRERVAGVDGKAELLERLYSAHEERMAFPGETDRRRPTARRMS